MKTKSVRTRSEEIDRIEKVPRKMMKNMNILILNEEIEELLKKYYPPEEKNILMTNPMSTSLLSLAPELVVMVASHLDVSSYLALASSSNLLLDILTSQVQWKALLRKTKMSTKPRPRCTTTMLSNCFEFEFELNRVSREVKIAKWDFERSKAEEMTEEVYQLARFLRNVEDSGGKLLLPFLDIICAKFPADFGAEKEAFSVRCPCQASIHKVSFHGFSMLEHVEKMARGAGAQPLQKLVAYEGRGVSPWGCFFSRASRQKEKVGKLEMSEVRTGEDGCRRKSREAWLKLLKSCEMWRIEKLNNIIFDPDQENSHEMLEGLAEESVGGEIGEMFTNERTIWQSGKSQLERVWKKTREWQVVCSTCNLDIERVRKD